MYSRTAQMEDIHGNVIQASKFVAFVAEDSSNIKPINVQVELNEQNNSEFMLKFTVIVLFLNI